MNEAFEIENIINSGKKSKYEEKDSMEEDDEPEFLKIKKPEIVSKP